jgi:ATP-binding cassette subfamily C protein CydD
MKKQPLLQIKQVRRVLILSVIFGLLSTIVLIAQMTFLSKIVNQVFLAHRNLAQVTLLLFFLLGTILVRAGFIWCREVTTQRGAIRVKAILRERLFAHVLQLGPSYCKNERTGELVATASEGIERLDAYVSRYLPQTVLSVVVPLLIAAYILPIDWSSAILLAVTAPVIPLLMILVGSYAESHIKQQWTALSRMSAYFLDVVQGLPTLKLLGRSGSQHERIGRVSNSFRERTMKVLRIAFLSGMVLELMTAFAIGLIAVTLGVRLLNGAISFEAAFLVLLLTPEFYHPLRELGVQRHAGMEGKAAATRIFEILETPLPIGSASLQANGVGASPCVRPSAGRPRPSAREQSSSRRGRTQGDAPTPFADVTEASCPTGQLSVEFHNVTYSFPYSNHPAINGINLVLPIQTCTALVGKSGAGKSTLVNLLMRFLDPQDGSISVNGISLSEMPVEMWRSSIALVPQRPYLFYGSVRANIRLARPAASDDEVIEAVRLAGATGFIEHLPLGYDTEIGERGARLSAGQVQRIAIARAFLKNAPLLILDEPTSSLDPESETLIRQALIQLMRDRTVLVIAHRYNTIAHAQQIAVMEEGRIVEVGSHVDLLRNDGQYAHLMGAYRRAEVTL